MKLSRSFLLTLVAVVAVPAVAAADNEKGPKILGVDGAVVLPLGNYGDAADLAVGGLLRFELPLTPELGVSVRAGFIYDLGTPEVLGVKLQTSYIPLYAGARYNLGSGGLFAAGEIGLTIARASAGGSSDSETKLGANVGAGYQKGKLSGRVSLWLPSLGDSGDVQGIMANIGIDILSL